MNYTISSIAALLNARWQAMAEDGTIDHLLYDSRQLLFPATTLFFALKSKRRDGHDFIPSLYQQGVRNFVVSDVTAFGEIPGSNVLVVDDVLKALQQLATFHREQFHIPVIGITGSNGKTIVKEWLNQLLEPDQLIVRSPRSYNSQIGVPLSVWAMTSAHRLGIFEAGISQPGEMAALAGIIQPTIGILTNIGDAHQEGFPSLEQKLREKALLFRKVEKLVYGIDNDLVRKVMKEAGVSGAQHFTWGRAAGADLRILEVSLQAGFSIAQLEYRSIPFSLRIPFTDAASIENAFTCTATMLCMGYTVETIAERIPGLHAMAMRLELKEGIGNCSVINDSYSADLGSLRIALDFLSQQQQHKKKTVILSDIPESGISPEQLYTRVAGLLKQHKVGRLIAIGPVIGNYLGLMEQLSGSTVQHYLSTDDLILAFHTLRFQDETILVKGARSFSFEQVSSMLEQQVHETVLEIDLNAMLHNLKQYQQVLHPSTRLMAMVKAFSYGSGSFEIANLLQFHKVDYLAVAYTDEGAVLRKGGIHLPIMVMNTEPSSFDAIVQHNLEPVVYSLPFFRAFDQFLKQEGLTQYPVHLELETGMNRLGFMPGDLPALLEMLPHSNFKVQSVFSHLVASEDPAEDAFTNLQAERFLETCRSLEKILPYSFIRHLENTAAIFRHPQWQFDMVRLGIGLYGVDPAVDGKLSLQEVSTLKSTIAQVKHLEPGDTVGYNRRGKIEKTSTIATVRIGYADGYYRRLGNGVGKMLVKGKLAPVIGTVCMDMTMIDVTGIEGVREGDEVVVFGKGLSVQTVAQWAGTIAYELMTSVSHRVKRVYFQD
ncbi:bifunctional UDP-N-acetylmuramoyl-tripeptide:D-alanyl-D-alanine ligase/alanine racemase [Flavihumibacter rivuli]|uniref:bifunctional UDP-N-acetylmuramoyl-tripeptide:D-alanyl-D-alanine ligase/alanine racemase n=1 Tax=Flavihumibacter rivuli TaxID=2838156 RepID=UPI001BDF5C19|nr:bifunctional UDP-N-acetylmuramoyl-tripeptide:D-alanyl-D-alanine ligase/alanine racemase [Flavihumibacter rivuli]ULQ54970.1 bifunctional UDP-N-acetylmuramoyl-tripeptide:D-alanyl-D-alanine ligase/alanine racemase [Flavihumibacter rivuli]